MHAQDISVISATLTLNYRDIVLFFQKRRRWKKCNYDSNFDATGHDDFKAATLCPIVIYGPVKKINQWPRED